MERHRLRRLEYATEMIYQVSKNTITPTHLCFPLFLEIASDWIKNPQVPASYLIETYVNYIKKRNWEKRVEVLCRMVSRSLRKEVSIWEWSGMDESEVIRTCIIATPDALEWIRSGNDFPVPNSVVLRIKETVENVCRGDVSFKVVSKIQNLFPF